MPNDPDTASARIADLRAEMETLMRDKIGPEVVDAAKETAESLTRSVRARPLTAILIAAAAVYLLGRASR
jgi:ElaB/YqjD/DUF883 family membrane-anchored ribosome-binding protein